MFFAAGAVGAAAIGALDLLSSLTPDKSAAAKTGVKQTNSLFDVIGSNSSTPSTTSVSSTSSTPAGALSPSTFNALLSAQDSNGKASPSDALKSLFAQIDGNGDGKINKAEFQDKLGAGGTNIAAADNVFNKMDANEDGSVSLDEMATALKGKGGTWTFEDLDKFLANPRAFVPGTAMSFAGVSRAAQRADIIAFLNSKSDKPAPLPQAAEAPAPQKAQ